MLYRILRGLTRAQYKYVYEIITSRVKKILCLYNEHNSVRNKKKNEENLCDKTSKKTLFEWKILLSYVTFLNKKNKSFRVLFVSL